MMQLQTKESKNCGQSTGARKKQEKTLSKRLKNEHESPNT